MHNIYKVIVGRDGSIVLPQELIQSYKFDKGSTVTLVDLDDGLVIMSPRQLQSDELLDQLAKELQESGETLDSILATLREVRAKGNPKEN